METRINDGEIVSDSASVSGQSQVLATGGSTSGVLRFIYNQNPFYLISACLVLHGISTTFRPDGAAMDPWLLAGLLGGYAALLAITCFLIVKIGSVWDDARSIFMVLLLLFFAFPISLDWLCLSSPMTALALLTCGFLFAVLTTEFLTRGLGIRMTIHFKVPYYLMLAAGILYPALVSFQLKYFESIDTRWVLAAFPVVCAATVLALLPGAQKNRKHVLKNGTPWHWPMFPYSVFVLLSLGLCGRTALMSIAFDPSKGEGSIFDSYFLVPIFIAVIVVLLEIAITERNRTLQSTLMLLLPAALPMAINWSNDSGQHVFVADITHAVGSPVWLSLIAIVLIYGIGVVRKVENASQCFSVSLVAAICLRPEGTIIRDLGDVAIWPVMLLAGFQLVSRERRQDSRRWFAACVVLILAGERVGELGASLTNSHPVSTLLQWGIASHFLLVAALLIGVRFRDPFARQLRVIVAFSLPLLAIAATVWARQSLYEGTLFALPATPMLPVVYGVALVLVGLAVFGLGRLRLYLYGSLVSVFATLAMVMTPADMNLRIANPELVVYGLIGLGCLLAGVYVSCLKAGMKSNVGRTMRREWSLVCKELTVFAAPERSLHPSSGSGES